MSLSVSAIGLGSLSYKWKKDGQDITDPECTGVDTSNLTICSFSHEHVGSYMCIVSNHQMTVESNPAELESGT